MFLGGSSDKVHKCMLVSGDAELLPFETKMEFSNLFFAFPGEIQSVWSLVGPIVNQLIGCYFSPVFKALNSCHGWRQKNANSC